MNPLDWFVVAFVAHEAAHYIAWRAIGVKPTVRFTWFGFEVGNIVQLMKGKIIDNLFVILAGPVAGFAFSAGMGYTTSLCYTVICAGDIVQTISHLELGRKYGWLSTLLEAEKKFIGEVENASKKK
jgi:hypothetical protein